MTGSKYFKKDELQKVINYLGKETYEKVLRNIKVYSEKWSLSTVHFIPSYSVNLVFKCYSKKFGNVVLKLGNPSLGEIEAEYNTLSQYNGRRFCKVYGADIRNGVILEECIKPGNTLREQSSLKKRLTVFCSLYKNLHVIPDRIDNYPTYTEWVKKITEYMSNRLDCKELYLFMKKAYGIHLEVSALYTQEKLLHGDFHHDNILLGDNGKYKIIDPKGVIGDPVLDVPRFILNEFDEKITIKTYKKINKAIIIFEEQLNIPKQILKKCLFVETAMESCWCVQDANNLENYPDLIQDVKFAETILNS